MSLSKRLVNEGKVGFCLESKLIAPDPLHSEREISLLRLPRLWFRNRNLKRATFANGMINLKEAEILN